MKRCPRCGKEHDGEGVSPSKQYLLICGRCYKQNEIDRKKPEARRGRLTSGLTRMSGLEGNHGLIIPVYSKRPLEIKNNKNILMDEDPVITAMEEARLKYEKTLRTKRIK
jgi:hypothetical protein